MTHSSPQESLCLPKLSLYVTLRCNLKCKLCAVYSPYYDNPFHPSSEYLKNSISKYFGIVDYVKLFSITGGEPLLRTDLHEIADYVYNNFGDRIDKFEIITNGTVLPTDKLQNSLRPFADKLNLLIDDYGCDKSLNAAKVADIFRTIKGANVIHRDYHSESKHCGGWVDYGISSGTIKRGLNDSKLVFQKCSHREKLNFCISLVNGKLYSCTQLRRLIELGIIQENPTEVIDIFDTTIELDDMRSRISQLYMKEILSACVYCNGLCDDSIRYPAGEQLSRVEECR